MHSKFKKYDKVRFVKHLTYEEYAIIPPSTADWYDLYPMKCTLHSDEIYTVTSIVKQSVNGSIGEVTAVWLGILNCAYYVPESAFRSAKTLDVDRNEIKSLLWQKEEDK